MCGICGIYDFRGGPIDRDLIDGMTSALRHRGPDGAGRYVAERIALGHRRLSIIDIEGGSQPLANEDNSIYVTFNGEIYNFIELREELESKGHVFKTRSDTEVVVHGYEQWGLECVNRFNGIFAFALWDANTERLVVARDHLGVKPLYYSVVGHRVLFASEIKSLLVDPECPRAVNVRALGQLFTLRYVPSPETLFDGINKLPPGHLMVIGPRGLEVRRYWTWRPQIKSDSDEPRLIESYRALVEDAVRLQMRSDVPVGLFLSSGVDSSTLLALMSTHGSGPLHTFSIGFDEGGGLNETADAREMAEIFGTKHAEMVIGPRDYEQYYERYLWDLEEPVGNETAAAFYFVSLLASRNVKVALSGQGADEPWAGYHRYRGIKLSELYSRLPAFLTEQVIRNVVERYAKNERLKRGVASLHVRDRLSRFIAVYSFYSAAMRAKLFLPWVREELAPHGDAVRQALRRLHADVEDLDALTQILYIDTRASLPDDLLMVADKTSMANSLEVRVPFLDYRLVEFIETLSPDLRLRGFNGKYLHKKAVEKWLPKKVVHRKKKGFANPIHKWLRDRMSHYVRDCLLSQRAAVSRYFDQQYIERLVADHEAGRQNHMRHLYLLISFEQWHQKFISA